VGILHVHEHPFPRKKVIII